jgi:tetratricopeptide (TPR) repeat protein
MRKLQIKWILAFVAAAVVAAVLSKARLANWLTTTGAAAGVAAVTVGAGLVQERMKSLIAGEDARNRQAADGIYMPGGHPPQVRHLTDPIAIGLHPAPPYQPPGAPRANRLPEYVPREADSALRDALASSGFVLLVGAAAAGKTRTAFEAVRAVLPRHVLIAPSAAEHFQAAASVAHDLEKCVLWLDDLQKFIGSGESVTRKSIAELLHGTGHHRVVLATMRTADENRLLIGGGTEPRDKLVVAGRDVLDQAEPRIQLSRLLIAAEVAGAAPMGDRDPRVADALRHADTHGLGEYLACGPQLYDQWEDAWTVQGQARAAAILRAAVDCRRAGFTAALPQSLLDSLHEEYLAERGGWRLNPEPKDDAWASLVRVRDAGSAPIQQVSTDSYDVFAYLVDEFQRRDDRPVPPATVRAALSVADPGTAGDIALTAREQRQFGLAEEALRTQYASVSKSAGPEASASLFIRANIAAVLHDQHLPLDAEREYAEILAALARDPAANQREVLRVRTNFASVLLEQGNYSAAEKEYAGILGALIALPDASQTDHRDILMVRGNLAGALLGLGRLDEAEDEYRAVAAARAATLGPEHPATLVSRSNLGVLLMQRVLAEGGTGGLERAEAEVRSVLEIRRRVLGPDHPHTRVSQENLNTLLGYRSGR